MSARDACFIVCGSVGISPFSGLRTRSQCDIVRRSRLILRRRPVIVPRCNIVAAEVPDEPLDGVNGVDESEQTFVLGSAPDLTQTTTSQLTRATKVVRVPAVGIADAVLVGAIIAVVYGLAATTRRFFFSTVPYTALTIDTSLRVLPSYALQSITRMIAGYGVSLVFSLAYAYIAYRVSFAAQALMLIIDVLQSIPLLSFLPGVVLGLISLFPAGARTGVELAAVLLLVTSMAWNMLLGFYQSLCCIPNDLQDVAKTFRLSPWRRFWILELPAGAIGLIWNSIISVAGGWFFLISIESFALGNRDFRLPGLGSFLAAAAEAGDYAAICAGLLVIIAIIVLVDFLVWRPLILWSNKFRHGSDSSDVPASSRSIVLNFLTRSRLMRTVSRKILTPAWQAFVSMDSNSKSLNGKTATAAGTAQASPVISSVQASTKDTATPVVVARAIKQQDQSDGIPSSSLITRILRQAIPWIVRLCFFAAIGVCAWKAAIVMRAIEWSEWIQILIAAACTFGRVAVALFLSLLWTVPVGIAIGRNPALAARAQPIVQVAASTPATALFPFVLLFLARLGGGLQLGSIALMMLGTMWYVLFNVIAGAQAIPPELFEVDAVYNRNGGWIRRWRTLILPGIFPYLITGVVTAVGGAWNASIVSEYVIFRGGVMKTQGLGAMISEAAATGNYPLLLAGTVVMSVLVLLTNRFVWGPLYRLAETKYRI